MEKKRFYCEIERNNGLTILSDTSGFILDPSDMLDIANEIIYTVNHYSDVIDEYNLEQAKKIQNLYAKYPKKQRYSRIYLMRCGEHYKVGVAIDVERRLKALDERPFKIALVSVSQPIPDAYKIEKEIYKKFEKNRIRGEWFNFNEDEAHFVSELIRTLGLEVEDA